MITGKLYISLVDGVWDTAPAAFISDDDRHPDRVIVAYFPLPPEEPPAPIASLVVSAQTALAAPSDGALIYVPD